MIYGEPLSNTVSWANFVPRQNYEPQRRRFLILLQLAAALLLILTVAALIVVFAVESSWFYDNFEGSSARYGLWRLCLSTGVCYSWFHNDGSAGVQIERRLNQSRAGINAWQALEIIFLFLTTSTLIILLIALVIYRFQYKTHYYLSILTVCCIWPAGLVGITVLFVFGFSVYNVSTSPRGLEWCFYVNLVAVILCLLASIILTVYVLLLKKPKKKYEDRSVVENFPDFESYPNEMSPSMFVIVRRDKKSRNEPYDYPQVLHPNIYPTNNFESSNPPFRQTSNQSGTFVPTETTTTTTTRQQEETHFRSTLPGNNRSQRDPTDLIPSASITTIGQQPMNSFGNARFHNSNVDLASSMNWRRRPTNDQFYLSAIPSNERHFERRNEPKLLHYYTGFDYFATVDPNENALSQQPIVYPSSPLARVHQSNSIPYQPSGDWLKSTI